jgi:AraC-like DNA-binding protein
MEPQLPLQRFRQFESRSLDEVRERIGQSYCPHRLDIARRGEHLRACFHRAPLVNLSINYLRYGAEVEIDPGELCSFYIIEFPLSGSARVKFAKSEVASGRSQATVLSPTTPFVSDWTADCAQIMVKIDRAALEKYVMDLIGRPLSRPIEFDPVWNISSGSGLSFYRLLGNTLNEMEERNDLILNRSLAGDVERALMAYLVHCQPSTCSDALQATVTPAAPRHVVKAVEFMHANLAQDISVNDLAAAAGVGARALHEGFKRFRSTTPMAALRAIRLAQARTALLAADEHDHVAAIAMQSGFTHLGRFSRLYRARYGEMPSQTLRRSVR